MSNKIQNQNVKNFLAFGLWHSFDIWILKFGFGDLISHFMRIRLMDYRIKKILVLSWLVVVWGCGYQMVGKETHIPPGLTSIAIPTFINQTFEPGIEVHFTKGFLREFIQDQRVKVVGRDEADSILEGVIKSFNIYSTSYDRSGITLEYQTIVVIDLTLKKRTGEILWTEKDLSESRWYRTSFNILTSESNKASAIQNLGRFMAERIRNRFFHQF